MDRMVSVNLVGSGEFTQAFNVFHFVRCVI